MAGRRLRKGAMVFSATFILLSEATAITSEQAAKAQQTNFWVMMVGMGLILYFLMIRPQQKQRKEQQKLIEALKTGDKVVTSAGIHGLIANVKEKTVLLKVADNVKIEIDKAAVATVLERSSDESAA